jgi:hypothetical protein
MNANERCGFVWWLTILLSYLAVALVIVGDVIFDSFTPIDLPVS